MLGKRLGPYEIIEPLGGGGMATVYRAYHPTMHRFVALKVLKDFLAFDKAHLGRFNQEARLIAQLEHPNLLPVYDFSADSAPAYIVMRYLEGTNLKAILDNCNALPFHEVVHITRQIASALDYAHSQGVIHRDIKPANIMLDTEAHCFLTDFGIASILGDKKSVQKGILLGTPAYMSPEQIRGKDKLSSFSDIYSFAVVIFEMATGKLPFNAPMAMGVMNQHLEAPVPSASQINPNLPKEFDAIMQKALAKNPEERFSTAGELRRALEALMNPNDAFMPHNTLKQIAKAEVKQILDKRHEGEVEQRMRDFETNRGPQTIKSRGLKASATTNVLETQVHKRSTFIYYIILLLFFAISVLLYVAFTGFPQRAAIQATALAQTRVVLGIAQTATAEASGTRPATSIPELIPNANSSPSPDFSPSPIANESANIPAQDGQLGNVFLNGENPQATLVFAQTEVFSPDTAFQIDLNPLASSLEPASLFADAQSRVTIDRIDDAGIHLRTTAASFFFLDSGLYTHGIEIGVENQPQTFFYLEAGETCVGLDYVSESVLYFDCLAGACTYLNNADNSKQLLPAGQRLITAFPQQEVPRIEPIPESAMLRYESFLSETGTGSNHLDCLSPASETSN